MALIWRLLVSLSLSLVLYGSAFDERKLIPPLFDPSLLSTQRLSSSLLIPPTTPPTSTVTPILPTRSTSRLPTLLSRRNGGQPGTSTSSNLDRDTLATS